MKRFAVAFIILVSVAAAATGKTWRVGPTERLTLVSILVDKLEPGDVVEVSGDITDSLVLPQSGTRAKPIVIRGIGDRQPRINFDNAEEGIRITGSWWIIENLDLSNAALAAVSSSGHGNVIRGCTIHDSRNGVLTAESADSGDILIEYCEFHGNGAGLGAHQLHLRSLRPRAMATVQFCYIHDSAGGRNILSTMAHNTIRYNWIERAENCEIDLADPEYAPTELRPMDAEIIGNVIRGDARGDKWAVISLGRRSRGTPGTRGSYTIANNILIAGHPTNRIIRASGRISEIRLFNNIIYGPALKSFHVFGPAEGARIERLCGAGNWIHSAATDLPDQLADTIRGDDPQFVHFEKNDLTLDLGSRCRSGGCVDCPMAAKCSPARARVAIGAHVKRPEGDKMDIGPFGVTVAGKPDGRPW